MHAVADAHTLTQDEAAAPMAAITLKEPSVSGMLQQEGDEQVPDLPQEGHMPGLWMEVSMLGGRRYEH